MPKILFIAAHRENRSPSQRFRFEQYFDYLAQNGFEIEFSPLITEADDKILYQKGNYFKKFILLIKAIIRRLKDIRKAANADVIFIQREAFLTGTTYFERKFKQTGKKIIFDFDDSIWLSNVSEANKKLNWLKNAQKTSSIIALSDMIFAGNAYLATYAKQYNKNVFIVPTTIDTTDYQRIPKKNNSSKICIGWSGSITTIQHFELAIPFLTELKKIYGDEITIKVIGDGNYINKELNITGIAWIKEREVEEISSFDIGIVPQLDDEWTRGKCGLKGLQYMSLEVPTIMSPVWMNAGIIQHGENGFFAATTEEWVNIISKLIESPELRATIGKAARKTAEDRYSVNANKDLYLKLINECINSK
ncbi:MAG: glycosyltransferase family 4 protein [Bacteroidia bacterium]|nr:glycosyltransferase family 4 protein [Bacteroidia bacterium]